MASTQTMWVAGVYAVYYRLIDGRFDDWSRSDKIALFQAATTIALVNSTEGYQEVCPIGFQIMPSRSCCI